MADKSWENHYTDEKSVLAFPDENLVRLLKKYLADDISVSGTSAIDLGCGSGRHLGLLDSTGIPFIIGIDYSWNALDICSKHYNCSFAQCNNLSLPLKDNSIDYAVAWGSLHYNKKDDLSNMINEILRVLKNEGRFFGTLRSHRDTYLKKGKHLGDDMWETDLNDLEGSIVSFYTEFELKESFKNFRELSYGIIERSIIGDLDKLISHWVLTAVK